MIRKQRRIIAVFAAIFLLFSTSLSGCKQKGSSSSSNSANSSTLASSATQSSTTSVPLITSGKLTVMFLNVGQGDSMFLSLPDGKTVLVDAGVKENGKPIVAFLLNHKVEKIDYLIATHSHSDHIGGLHEVLSSLNIGKLFYPSIPESVEPSTKEYKNFTEDIKLYHYQPIAPKAGTILFEGNGYKAECFGPISSEYSDLNSYSIVFKLTFGSNTFLFMSDSLKENEKEMLNAGYDLKADVLKVGHHGDNDASGKSFLLAVKPKYAVIPCSGDTKNHPDEGTVTKLNGIGATVLRTDLNGTVIITSDGKNLSVAKNAAGPNGN